MMISALSMGSMISGADRWSDVQRSPASPSSAAPQQDFGSVLQGMASSAIDTLRQGESAAAAGITGAMPVQQVVDQVLAAERTLQATIAVRDKLVGAYLEISRMQI